MGVRVPTVPGSNGPATVGRAEDSTGGVRRLTREDDFVEKDTETLGSGGGETSGEGSERGFRTENGNGGFRR